MLLLTWCRPLLAGTLNGLLELAAALGNSWQPSADAALMLAELHIDRAAAASQSQAAAGKENAKDPKQQQKPHTLPAASESKDEGGLLVRGAGAKRKAVQDGGSFGAHLAASEAYLGAFMMEFLQSKQSDPCVSHLAMLSQDRLLRQAACFLEC